MQKNNISIIVSSHLTTEQNSNFIKHIGETIGVNHEVKIIQNFNQYSLSQVYNQAIKEYYKPDNIMIFCHPDIEFKTKNWGKLILSHFRTSDYGIIGVAGTTYLPESGRWWEHKEFMIGVVNHADDKKEWTSVYSQPFNGIKSVTVIDGLFMCVDPDKIKTEFDENYGKFHFYDISFCYNNFVQGVDIGVIYNVRLSHKSIGKTNEDWERNRVSFAEKNKLPLIVEPEYGYVDVNLTSTPKVGVIIPTKNNFDILKENIDSWNDVVEYENYEIIIADTGSDEDVLSKYPELLSDKIKLIKYDYYNFGKINNDVVKNHISADTDILLFCNDDIELLNDAVTKCVDLFNKYKNAGTIGIRLHYKNGLVQHNGIKITRVKDKNGLHLSHVDLKKNIGYSTGVNLKSIGNTGAFLMISKNLFNEIGGFNENYIDCLEDVELNLECLLRNKINITVSDAVAYHYESVSRNRNKDKIDRINDDYFNRLEPFYRNNKTKIDKSLSTR